MNTVFVGGSRHVSRLPEEARKRLENIMAGHCRIVIGDAKGADTAVQKLLFARAYDRVVVFCSGDRCRNNVGEWETRKIPASKKEKGFAFYALKDREMAQEADYGYMIWDGKSPGTLLNVLRLLQFGKKAVLLDTTGKQTTNFRQLGDWRKFISRLADSLIEDLRARAAPGEWLDAFADDASPHPDEPGQVEATADERAIEAINSALEKLDGGGAVEVLGEIAKKRGMSDLAKSCGLARESLYRSLSREGNPEFETVLKVLHAMGLKLVVNNPGSFRGPEKDKRSQVRP